MADCLLVKREHAVSKLCNLLQTAHEASVQPSSRVLTSILVSSSADVLTAGFSPTPNTLLTLVSSSQASGIAPVVTSTASRSPGSSTPPKLSSPVLISISSSIAQSIAITTSSVLAPSFVLTSIAISNTIPSTTSGTTSSTAVATRPATKTSSKSSSLSIPVIIAIVAGILFVVTSIVVFLVWWIQKRKKEKKRIDILVGNADWVQKRPRSTFGRGVESLREKVADVAAKGCGDGKGKCGETDSTKDDESEE